MMKKSVMAVAVAAAAMVPLSQAQASTPSFNSKLTTWASPTSWAALKSLTASSLTMLTIWTLLLSKWKFKLIV